MAEAPTVLRARPRIARALTGSGALPSLENLARKTPDELIRTLRRFGIEPDLGALERSSNAAMERLDSLAEAGIEPDDATWREMERQVEREARGQLEDMTRAAIRNYQLAKARAANAPLLWLTSGSTDVCESCEPRHGKSATLAAWTKRGLPGSPVLVCCSGRRRNCQCELLPELRG